MTRLILLLILLNIVYNNCLEFKEKSYYSVHCNYSSRGCVLQEGKNNENSHAYGVFESSGIMVDGWGKIWVYGDSSNEGWYESGFLEGSLTSLQVYQHYKSWYDYQFGSNTPTNETMNFLLQQYEYSLKLIEEKKLSSPSCPYYNRLGQVMSQFQGMLDGINYGAETDQSMSLMDLLLLEAAGDLYDIIPATNPDQFKLQVGKLSKVDFFDEWHKAVSCSALIKMKDDASDVFAGQTTWTSYQNMLRIYKNYNMGDGEYMSSHSSKPGVIYSKDDFYSLPREDQSLVVMETTNGVINKNLYDLVTPESLLTWQRIPIANSLSLNGKDWTNIFAKHNSGTYCNQYMVVDMKLFVPGEGPLQDFLWIIEVAPGITESQDVTEKFISNGNYWPSFNLPYQEFVYIATGFQSAYEEYGDSYSYVNCTRSKMFARDQIDIKSENDFSKEMRYNKWQTDPLSNGDASAAISSRKDLKASGASAGGGIDSKVTSFMRMKQSLKCDKEDCKSLVLAEAGPTHDDQVPFQWSTSPWNDRVHLGQPDIFDFEYVEIDYFKY
jgi:hypothetical protein